MAQEKVQSRQCKKSLPPQLLPEQYKSALTILSRRMIM